MSQAQGFAAQETAKFDAIADEWRDPTGPMRPLHAMQPVRLDYARAQFMAAGLGAQAAEARRPFAGIRMLDIGCGAGLATEPFARLGAQATGLDLSEKALETARRHATAAGLPIRYVAETIEARAAKVAIGDDAPYDAALALEVVEHLDNRAAFLAAAAECLRPGAPFVLTTLARTAKSFAAAIVGAEYVLRWLPRGTHSWRKFVDPDDLAAELDAAGFEPIDRVGLIYSPLSDMWRTDECDLSINYAMTAIRRG